MCDERGESLAGPSGCLQYFTGTTGRVSSFGFPETTATSIGDDGKDPKSVMRGDPNRAPDTRGGYFSFSFPADHNNHFFVLKEQLHGKDSRQICREKPYVL